MKGRVDEISCLSIRVLLESIHMPVKGRGPTLLQNAIDAGPRVLPANHRVADGARTRNLLYGVVQ
jgi:hypothetical protein